VRAACRVRARATFSVHNAVLHMRAQNVCRNADVLCRNKRTTCPVNAAGKCRLSPRMPNVLAMPYASAAILYYTPRDSIARERR